ncbi:DUF5343 domain-containing protein [Ideonella sp. B7]|uniref:DUF5343 domain-containing protein n=1 Tax=Ideonella benzenivorans TaxID=2831643 RepID=UPI001CEDBD34|nr:DUF5343 domain-containing protein [Ideonella benzenivorans]MCA6217048.1 DUF5343 domain-containing protein [Ideonella benzenivorans]
MATSATYPKIGRKIWALVRDRFKKSLPSTVTPTFIGSLATMTDASAKANVISPLRQLGLLDDANKPTELASRWRHDDEYKSVCDEIRSKTYPSELLEAFPDADSGQKKQIETWFMKVGHVGESAARLYTDTYMLLTEADAGKLAEKASNGGQAKASATKTPQKRRSAQKVEKSDQPPALPAHPPAPVDPPQSHGTRRLPAIHIDVQVHISPETPPEQIDRIFESMAKHLGTYIK